MHSIPGKQKTSRIVLLVALFLLIVALVPMIRFFVVPIVLATTFSALFYPLYHIMVRVFKNRILSSLLCCVLLLVGMLIPAYILVHIGTVQTIELYHTVEPKIEKLTQMSNEALWGKLKDTHLFRLLPLARFDWKMLIQQGLKNLGSGGTALINKTSAGVFGLIINFAVMFYTMFFFFLDGDRIVEKLKYLIPVRNEYIDTVIGRFLRISRATITGTLVVGLVQGTLAGITLLLFGIETWLIWGLLMVLLAVIPMLGTWLVMIPVSIVELAIGHVWTGIGILAINTLFIANVDNVLRPRLVGHGARMHDLVIFFSMLGGIGVFGVMGFIVGPVIAALFVAVIDIYQSEFKEELSV
jgi:predicted PurR-regulated permease PerM